MLRIFKGFMPLRVAAHKRIASDPLVNLPNKGGPLTPVGVRLVASVGFDESNPRSKRHNTTAQFTANGSRRLWSPMALAHHAVGLLAF